MSATITPIEKGLEYRRWIARGGLSDTTKQMYPARVEAYLVWLEENFEEHPDALVDPYSRDYAVRDYRRDLLTVDKRAIATVELTLSALGSFYDWLGLGKPDVQRMKAARGAPKGLEPADKTKVLRAAQRRGLRDFALTGLLVSTAVRVSEAHDLNTDDLFISDRSGLVEVRYGKGGKPRQVPVPADAREALRPYLAWHREHVGEAPGTPLFVARGGARLSVRRMQSLMASIGEDAGVRLTPHVLRHTYARNFLDAGGDVASLQEVLGHTSLASTMVYTRPHAGRVAELAENVRMEL